MHLFRWLFWIAVIVALFSLFMPMPRRRRRATSLEVLQRRCAASEITDKEYEERKAKLKRDAKLRV